MAYTENKKANGLDELTSLDTGDLVIVADSSDSFRAKKITKANSFDLKADLASPTFTGTPILPTGTTGTTQSQGDNSTKLATTAYVDTTATSILNTIENFLYKTTTQTVNNSDVLQNDDTFTFTVEANKSYKVSMMLGMVVSAIPDLKFDFSIPVGATLYGVLSNINGTSTFTESVSTMAGGAGSRNSTLDFVLINSSNAGTVTFRWAQNTATVIDTQVLAGSFMSYKKLN